MLLTPPAGLPHRSQSSLFPAHSSASPVPEELALYGRAPGMTAGTRTFPNVWRPQPDCRTFEWAQLLSEVHSGLFLSENILKGIIASFAIKRKTNASRVKEKKAS
jgi:hypothetical protein